MPEVTEFFQVGGTLEAAAPSYIERAADHELLAALEQGELCLVLAPRQTGKSSLMVHAVSKLKQRGAAAGIVDLQPLGSQQNPDQWFCDVLYQIERSLRLDADSSEWWESHDRLGPTQRFMTFLEDVVLAELSGNVVIFFDEIDSALGLPFSDDFFTTIRSLYNARAVNPTLRRLTFVLLGVATPSSFIQDRSRTPFNIGRSIILGDFERAASEPFQEVLGQGSEPLIDRIFYWTEGQPLMVQALASSAYLQPHEARAPEHIDQEVERAYLQKTIDQNTHLKFIQDYLLDHSGSVRKTMRTYWQVLMGKHVAADERSPEQSRLRLAGVVRVTENRLAIRNRIYANIFNLRWVRDNTPSSIFRLAIYGASALLVAMLMWRYVAQPLFLPFAHLPRNPKLVRHTAESAIKITFPTPNAKVSRADLDQKEVLVPRDGTIRATLTDLPIGLSTHQLQLSGGLLKSSYVIPIEVTYYPRWELRQFPSHVMLNIFDELGFEDLSAFAGHRGPVSLIAFAPDGKLAVSGSSDGTLKLWDVKTGAAVRTLRGHRDGVIGVAFAPDGKWLASGSSDGTLKLWDVETGRETHTLTGHSSGVNGVAFSPDGKTVVSGSDDQTLKLWDVGAGKEARTLSGHSDGVIGVAFAPDGKTIISGSSDQTLKLWNAATGQEMRTFSGHEDGVIGVAFSPDGKSVISSSIDGTLKLWDVDTGQALRTFEGHSGGVIGVAFSPDGQTVLSGSSDQTLKLWDVDTGQALRTFEGHSGGVFGVAFSPDAKTVLSGSDDTTLKLWWAALDSH